MSKYELWLNSCNNKNTELHLLEQFMDIRLFKLIKYNRDIPHYENNYNYIDVSFHVWNIITGEWVSTLNYNEALTIYNNRKISFNK